MCTEKAKNGSGLKEFGMFLKLIHETNKNGIRPFVIYAIYE